MMEIREIEELIKAISKFPGLGPKSAKRIILKLKTSDELSKVTGGFGIPGFKWPL